MTKKELRAGMKRLNLALTPEARAAASSELFRRVERLPAFAAAKTVALYCALADEPSTEELLARWGGVKRIVLPRVEGTEMRFYEYAADSLCTGAFGIPEPGPGSLLCDPPQIDLIVVPGAAFTPSGARLGRGKGYYDRYLSQPGFRAVKVGLCYAHQVVGELPVEPHDIFMDHLCFNECEYGSK